MNSRQINATTVDEYIAAFPPNVRAVLTRVRSTIKKALPGAEEAISYKIPAFRLHGRVVVYFAGWTEHYSLYPVTERLASAMKKELSPYEMSGKGTIRFPIDEPVPARLIAAIARFRAKESAARAKAKTAAKKK
jgi:uncharacterized protein YdhG (YjbR/CyaY superfamily)